jgi:glycosyltransferase involved in cell wall biosynthesis
MKVVYHHRTQGAGAEGVHISSMIKGFEELGYSVSVVGPPGVTLNPNRTMSGSSSFVGRFFGVVARKTPQIIFEFVEIAYNLISFPRLLKFVRSNKPDFIYERYSLYCLVGVLVSASSKTPIILEMNDTVDMDRSRQGRKLIMVSLAQWFERFIMNRATLLVVVSTYLKSFLVEKGIPPEKIVVTPNAVHADIFDPSRFDREAIREKRSLNQKVVVGFVGAFVKWHRTDLLIQALARVIPTHPNVVGLLVGSGVEEERCKLLAIESGICENVLFSGQVPHESIPEYVFAMDMGVMPGSNVFGSPMKIFEYMAMGVPAIGPRYSPIEEIIDDGVNGYIFTPEDLNDLTKTILQFVDSSDLRKEFGSAARKKILSKHLWSHNAANAVDGLARVIAGSSG